MKHVFMMHSAITYMASLSVISAEELNEDDCIFVFESTDRGFPEFVKTIYLANKDTSGFGATNKVDEVITEAVNNEDFIAYIGSMNGRARIIVSNHNCKGFNFIEEGNAAYYTSYNYNLFMNEYPNLPIRINCLKDFINNLLCYLKLIFKLTPVKLLSLPINYSNYAHVEGVTFYCLNKYTFPLADKRKEISLGGKYLEHLPRKYTLDNSFVWVSSRMFECYNKDTESLKKAMVDSFNYLKELLKIDTVFIKYHQYESSFSREATTNVFDIVGIPYTIMDDSAIMEIELAQAKNVTVIGDLSSLLFYNVLFKNKSYSIIKRIEKHIVLKETDYNSAVIDTFKEVVFI